MVLRGLWLLAWGCAAGSVLGPGSGQHTCTQVVFKKLQWRRGGLLDFGASTQKVLLVQSWEFEYSTGILALAFEMP